MRGWRGRGGGGGERRDGRNDGRGRGGRGGGNRINQQSGEAGNGEGGSFRQGGGPRRGRRRFNGNFSEEMGLEARLGFDTFTEGEARLGWLLNMSPSSLMDEETNATYSCMNLYFVCQDRSTFKAQVKFEPYFYIGMSGGVEMEVDSYLRRKYEGIISNSQVVEKEDLDLKNHLSGLRHTFLKLSFKSVQDLMEVRKEVAAIVARNQAKLEASQAYETLQHNFGTQSAFVRPVDYLENLTELREYDVPYHVRFAIDVDVRCGHWYTVKFEKGETSLERRADLLQRAEPCICAFDIETTKLPLKFPDASYDLIMMISYMINGKGYLIINREVVGADINDLEYTPKPEYRGEFTVWNVASEYDLLRKWFDHMREVKPGIYVTYNGDFFDWPFIEERAKAHGFSMLQRVLIETVEKVKGLFHARKEEEGREIGFRSDSVAGECRSKFSCHLDAFSWVKRDSYLPQGSQGLKAVTRAKLGFDPVEVDPEDMLNFAIEQPQTMAQYSVSDAVATYYLYMTYVHPFIYSLSTIIPMPPDEVLRKGSGTLCEMLLMVQAFKGNIICPNKKVAETEKFHKGKLLESETYIGGHVECIESGVFRSDLPTRFRLNPPAFQLLIDKLDDDLVHALKEEGHMAKEDVSNYDDVKMEIISKLEALRDTPNREECPVIYHLDVAAMYPNIMLTNRLQPPSIVTDDVCAACAFNRPGKTCLRSMEWVWRGEAFAAGRSEYLQMKTQIESEQFAWDETSGSRRYFHDLPKDEQQAKLKERFKKYCQKVYKRVLEKPATEIRIAGVCQRENSFYIDTVRSFRDRRYEYKGSNKAWKGKLSEAKKNKEPEKIREAEDMVVLYDSLQLAHKCILNSFYGYVMRKGARWYSMEMAGITTYTGAKLIQSARVLVEQVGKPLELDTDGIWCCLPGSFPENFVFKPKDPSKKKLTISYPCVMLNADVKKNNTNDQYQTLNDTKLRTYTSSSECSIAFEVDGPYKAMILPASKEEGVLIKKRYAVFNEDGSLAELKGFEIKRRGELKLIKIFQAEVFKKFLCGSTLEECYAAVAEVGNRLLDMLESRGAGLEGGELLEYISESSTMSKALEEYGARKSCAATCARRLADFLGDAMVKDKGLSCQYIVARYPQSAPVSERAIPVAIFSTEAEVMRAFLRRWCKEGHEVDVRSILDWDYYRGRLSSAIQKIISIPAAMQKVKNPVPRVIHPDWLGKVVREREDKHRQRSILDLMGAHQPLPPLPDRPPDSLDIQVDMEDMGSGGRGQKGEGKRGVSKATVKRYARQEQLVAIADREGNVNVELCDSIETEIEGSAYDGARAEGTSEGGGLGTDVNGEELLSLQGEDGGRSKSPDRRSDYSAWLEHKKRKWKAARDATKRRRLVSDMGEQETPLRRVSAARERNVGVRGQARVRSFFQEKEAALARSTWQIVQLCEESSPGEFTAWVIAGKEMHKVPLRVERKFYVNMKAEGEAVAGVRVNRTLPRRHRSYCLYQVTLPEAHFRQAGRLIADHLADPNIEGVYEANVPLAARAVLEVGCVCTVDERARKRSLAEGWALHELHMKTTAECSYLGDDSPSLSFFFLYHSPVKLNAPSGSRLQFTVNADFRKCSASEPRGLYALYSQRVASVLVLIVNPFSNREVTAGQMERQLREAVRATAALTGLQDTPENLNVKLEWASTNVEALRRLQGAIGEYGQQQRGPTVALVESPNGNALREALPALTGFPCVTVPCNARDSQYQALAWQPAAARAALQRCAAAGAWLAERTAAARYAHVPLGNFEPDWLLYTADAFFARALRDRQQVLWMASDGIPDLGGGLPDEDCSFIDEVQQPELIYAGAYNSIVVEFKINNLAVNALLKSSTINEMEGGALLGADLDLAAGNPDPPLGGSVTIDESAACGPALRVLRQMVHAWMGDAVGSSNMFAELLLRHLYRWICSPQSRLHDPAIHRVLHKVMRKVFAMLLAEMKKLGATLVYADFSRIVIATGKRDNVAAQAFCDYLLKTMKARELFEWLHLEPQRAWQSFLFMDQNNYGGIVATLYGDQSSSVEGSVQAGQPGREGATEDAVESRPDVICSWNIAEYLPRACQEYFIMLVSEYIWIPWTHAREMTEARAGDSTSSTPSILLAAQVDIEAMEAGFIRDKVESYFTEKLLTVVKDIQQYMAVQPDESDESEDAAERRFPQLAGSHLELGSPAVEFVKSICAVFALDQRVQDEVLIMRRQLLKLVKVREFSIQASFRDPCLSFTLPNVICSYCNDCRDLDLCRDVQLLSHEWRCAVPSCQQPYNREWIENALLQIVRQRCRAYQLQDLKCSKCRQVKAARLAEHCSCAGSWQCMETPSDLRQRLRVFLNISRYHKFQLLEECVQWLLKP